MKRYNITVNGTAYDVTVEETEGGAPVQASAPAPKAARPAAKPAPSGAVGGVRIEAPMPGTVMDVKLKVGDKVSNGTPIVIIEAMKMENEIPATCEGTIASINVAKGDSVSTGTLIATINA
ncbi:MAG: acetyl-CoA carboxylase biotin carboxyl carrier protein subunit [Bacteroides sp.]|nr:acetyl-CoA carboxylase biotin carboxyl carrier protein subunit [Eubacterium sp.]MCM1417576.1 acetyl-CoA carboxylase biotin carboxyl carrier protein subunit [Roseburia sp.]MCM1461713.1 acetyl-CoA carboxylase biotin carboxyl carrier protein subunit [Bacteroides sp.]